MFCRVFACDFDGTGATSSGDLAPELAATLGAARAQGYTTLLVTGRVHEEVEALCTDLSMFDAVVAENGAVICLPGLQRTIQLGTPPPEHLLGELRARGVPFQSGAVIVGTWDRHAAEVLELIRHDALDAQLIFNRAAMMLLPTGINKAVGVRRALAELERSEHNLIAFGDAENDLPLFALAEVSVAARGAVPAVAAQADVQLSHPGGAGVAQYIQRVLQQGGIVPTPPRCNVTLGTATDGEPALLPASGVNVMVTGDPRSGKSWLTGLLAENLIEQGYRLCVIDPEGDYTSLRRRPLVLLLGDEIPLPEPTVVPHVFREQSVSVVLDLASLSVAEQMQYVDAVLSELEVSCAATGIPHWILVDEAQYFFHEPAAYVPHCDDRANFLFATYRPSELSSAVVEAVNAHLVTHTAVEEERYFITSLLRARGPRELMAGDALAQLDLSHAGLLLEEARGARWQVFAPAPRVTAHAHHARKYVDTPLPEHKAFRFLHTNGVPVVARSVIEFHRAVQRVPLSSLRHHLGNGDFSRWAAEVLGDQQLARGLRKLEWSVAAGAAPDRAEILAHVEDHYLIAAPPADCDGGSCATQETQT
jgi:hydroxymethylpyrimidine pyrophosphatase-like HAD family hydrolase